MQAVCRAVKADIGRYNLVACAFIQPHIIGDLVDITAVDKGADELGIIGHLACGFLFESGFGGVFRQGVVKIAGHPFDHLVEMIGKEMIGTWNDININADTLLD